MYQVLLTLKYRNISLIDWQKCFKQSWSREATQAHENTLTDYSSKNSILIQKPFVSNVSDTFHYLLAKLRQTLVAEVPMYMISYYFQKEVDAVLSIKIFLHNYMQNENIKKKWKSRHSMLILWLLDNKTLLFHIRSHFF